MKHVMIDFETLATTPDAVVLSLGAVKFNEKGVDREKVLHHQFNIDQQLAEGRKISGGTFSWWMSQTDEARLQFTNPGRIQLPVGTILDAFEEFFVGAEYVWSHGSNFDTVILESLYQSRDRKAPWRFQNVRDTRTLFALYDSPLFADDAMEIQALLKPDGLTAHNALLDAINQAEAVRYALGKCHG